MKVWQYIVVDYEHGYGQNLGGRSAGASVTAGALEATSVLSGARRQSCRVRVGSEFRS